MKNIDVYKLDDGCSMSIAQGWGCNMFSWIVNGKELMYCPKDLPQTAEKITGGGTPILFPSVGRTWDYSSGEPVAGYYRIYGDDKTYFMPSHGVLFMSDFQKIDEKKAEGSITATYETRISEKVREENYPFDLSLTQSFTLKAESVELEARIQNNGDVPAPCAFGYHPYFAISNPKREGVTVKMPVTKRFMLTPKTVMFTGETQPTSGIFDLDPDLYYDQAFGEPDGTRMSLSDAKAGHTIYVDFDKKCELFFLYSPDGSDFVCIEPWTRGLGAYEQMKEPDWQSGELIPVLQPGEVMDFKAVFSVGE